MCDSSAYSYSFEIFIGAGSNVILHNMPDLGPAANVVRLPQTIPNFVNHIVYFNNFYTTLPLFIYLRSRGIYALGTIRSGRIPNCSMIKIKSFLKQVRDFLLNMLEVHMVWTYQLFCVRITKTCVCAALQKFFPGYADAAVKGNQI